MGKGTKIQIPQPPPPRAAEKRYQELGLKGQELAFEQAGYDIITDPVTGEITLKKRAPTETEKQLEELTGLGLARAKEALSGEYSPETRALVKSAYDPARERGTEDIRQFALELAGEKGLNLSDTPVGGEALRAQERLLSRLSGAEANALINVQGRQQEFALASEEFQENLRQRSLQNRLALAGGSAQAGLGLGQLRSSLFRPMAVDRGGLGLSDVGDFMGGAGKFLAAAKAFFPV